MSRAPRQLTGPSQDIFCTLIIQSDGTQKQVLSGHSLGDTSIRINTREKRLLLLTSMALSCLYRVGDSPNPYLYLSVIDQLTHYRGMVPDIWTNIFEFLPGYTPDAGDYALSIQKPSLFKKIAMDPAVVVDAVMRGQEDVVMNILSADPSYLLKDAIVENSVGVKSKRTPLEAAIMANDVQMMEKMEVHFKRLTTDLKGNPINGLDEMHRQMKAIYKESLKCFYKIEKEKIKSFEAAQAQDAALETMKKFIAKSRKSNLQFYAYALGSDDINLIVQTHHEAQERNVFNFEPYVDAILDPNLPEAELDAVMALINAKTPEETAAACAGFGAIQTDEARAKAFGDLTLIEKLNRFREEFVKHMQKEIIFNSHHILCGLKSYDTACDTFPRDPEYKRRNVIFTNLVGWAQRKAAEPVLQDIRQGTDHLTEENEQRTRASRFNEFRDGRIIRNFFVDVSLHDSSLIDGLGFKCGVHWNPRLGIGGGFSKLMSSKNIKLEELMSRVQSRVPEKSCCCVVQ